MVLSILTVNLCCEIASYLSCKERGRDYISIAADQGALGITMSSMDMGENG